MPRCPVRWMAWVTAFKFARSDNGQIVFKLLSRYRFDVAEVWGRCRPRPVPYLCSNGSRCAENECNKNGGCGNLFDCFCHYMSGQQSNYVCRIFNVFIFVHSVLVLRLSSFAARFWRPPAASSADSISCFSNRSTFS